MIAAHEQRPTKPGSGTEKSLSMLGMVRELAKGTGFSHPTSRLSLSRGKCTCAGSRTCDDTNPKSTPNTVGGGYRNLTSRRWKGTTGEGDFDDRQGEPPGRLALKNDSGGMVDITLGQRGLVIDQASRSDKLLQQVANATTSAAERLKQNANSDYSPDANRCAVRHF